MQNPHSKPAAVLLSVAGSDCSGGAGLQADLKTAGVFGVFCATVITAITAQNPQALHRVFSLPADQVKAQWDAVVQGLPISAVKLGMLGDGATARAVAENLAALRKTHPRLPIVIEIGRAHV